jgi:hypothetical protein
MKSPSESSIDLVAASLEEEQRRPVSAPAADPAEIDKLAETVRIERTPRAQTTEREMLRHPFTLD